MEKLRRRFPVRVTEKRRDCLIRRKNKILEW